MGKKKGKNKTVKVNVDLPLASFVDTPEKNFRTKKSDCGNRSVKKMEGKSSTGNSEAVVENWFDREEGEDETIDDLHELSLSCCDEYEKSVSSISLPEQSPSSVYNFYPLDFWYLVSKHIEPEQVITFALICKTSYSIIQTQMFWKRLYIKLYTRHYLNNPESRSSLPERLKPENIQRPRGLIPSVVRFLYSCHPPFVAQRTKALDIWPDPQVVVGKICSVHWCRKISNKHVHVFFKLRNEDVQPQSSYKRSQHDNLEELIEELEDIRFNPEEGAVVLQVVSQCWSNIPPVMGLKLHKVGLSVSHGMRFHKLKLHFGSPQLRGECKDTTQVLLDSVVSVKIHNWWHPHYP